MRHYIIALAASSLLFFGCGSTKDTGNDLAGVNPIQAHLDLTTVKKDKLPVKIDPGRFVEDTVIYRLPRVIPGTYAVSDFGSFVENFRALDYQGNELAFEKLDDNSWAVYGALNLDRLEYEVNDTFDIEGTGVATPFSPTGTNISPENYVLNLYGFVGYFDALINNPYELTVKAFSEMKRTSALPLVNEIFSADSSEVSTTYVGQRYFDVMDNPMMYGSQDVESFDLGNIEVVLSVYSPNGVHSAKSLKEVMRRMMKAQKNYLGDLNSTDRYDVFVYLADASQGQPRGFGALEHHTSTVVVMPETMPANDLEKGMIDVVSHEFFHILTPLSVHSEDVHYFDYHDPSFSKHLWMYEGLTEYFATHFQVNQGLVDEEGFYNEVMEKMQTSWSLDDNMSFTVMSENILDEPYKSNYYNVYQKGALIGMCLDIILREESNGQRGVLDLMKDLSVKYGVDRPFVDDEIIDEIVDMTYPAVGDFFETHVIGEEPIDYNKYLNKAGLNLAEGRIETNYIQNAGVLILHGDRESGTIFFNPNVSNNSFWHESGAKENDIIREVNGTEVTLENANAVFGAVYSWKPGMEVEVKLERDGEEILINEVLTPSYTTGLMIRKAEDPSPEQKALLEAWLKG